MENLCVLKIKKESDAPDLHPYSSEGVAVYIVLIRYAYLLLSLIIL